MSAATTQRPANCPLCGRSAEVYLGWNGTARTDQWDAKCATCGHVRIDQDALRSAREEGKVHLLSAFFRRLKELKVPAGEVPVVTGQNYRIHLAVVPDYTPLEKADRLLSVAGQMSDALGATSSFDPITDYPLIAANNQSEALFIIRELNRAGLVSLQAAPFAVTLAGWKHIEELRRAGKESFRAFVAMWFDPNTDKTYSDAIEPAITESGYHPLRIDREEHVSRIDDAIIAGLRSSRFLVADFTGNRGGVYFEAGFMQGLGRNVFWVCSQASLGDLHFDVNHFNFIVYGTAAELRQKLKTRILAVEGQGGFTI